MTVIYVFAKLEWHILSFDWNRVIGRVLVYFWLTFRLVLFHRPGNPALTQTVFERFRLVSISSLSRFQHSFLSCLMPPSFPVSPPSLSSSVVIDLALSSGVSLRWGISNLWQPAPPEDKVTQTLVDNLLFHTPTPTYPQIQRQCNMLFRVWAMFLYCLTEVQRDV